MQICDIVLCLFCWYFCRNFMIVFSSFCWIDQLIGFLLSNYWSSLLHMNIRHTCLSSSNCRTFWPVVKWIRLVCRQTVIQLVTHLYQTRPQSCTLSQRFLHRWCRACLETVGNIFAKVVNKCAGFKASTIRFWLSTWSWYNSVVLVICTKQNPFLDVSK